MVDWISLSQSSGSGYALISVTASANISPSRTTSLIVSGHNKYYVVDVEQEIADVISPTSYLYEDVGGVAEFTISSNVDWVISSYPEWLTINTLSGNSGITVISASASTNTGDTKRTSSIVVSGDSLYGTATVEQEANMATKYLTFKITEPGNIEWRYVLAGESKVIYYSLNQGPWTTLSVPYDNIISVNAGDEVRFKGYNYTYEGNRFYFASGFTIEGNIMSLINGDYFSSLDTLYSSNTFEKLFVNCKGLTDASKLLLPATTLRTICYADMFENCTSLTKAPALPATTAVSLCYANMFSGCTSLTTAPELPATTLGAACYEGMFAGCISLTSAPVLPATTLEQACYQSMFGGCTSLTSAPVLPATTMKFNCYNSMFAGCTSLTTAPSLPSTDLYGECYFWMFKNCTSLTSAPVLPATTLYDCSRAYYGMFENCTSLMTAPALPATTLAPSCYYGMFAGCTSLTTAQSVLPATTLTSGCYSYMFSGCTSLTTAPELPASTLVSDCYSYMFYGCNNLSYIKCLATSIPSSTGATRYWVADVSQTGEFVKAASMRSWESGYNGIPYNWTIRNA